MALALGVDGLAAAVDAIVDAIDAPRPERHRLCNRRQTKLMDDLASKYAKTPDAAAPVTTAEAAATPSSDDASEEVVTKMPLGTRLKNVGKRLLFWRK
jgi:hypothetical protein